MKHKINYLNLIGYLLFAACLIYIIDTFQYCLGTDIWYDELFSVGMVPYSFRDIVAFTAKDVHPPFYYFYIKIFYHIIAVFIPTVSIAVTTKIASLIPMVLLLIYSYFLIGKREGIFVAGFFSWCVFSMPQIMAYSVEIRMYSLALFLITAAFYHAMSIIRDGKIIDWIFLIIYGILTVYTQYFAGLAIVGIYLCMATWFLLYEKKKLKQWLLAIGISTISYIPWLIILTKQISQVQSSYWIQPLTFRSIFGCIKYIFLPSGNNQYMSYGVALFLILGFALFLFFYIKKRIGGEEKDKFEIFQILAGLIPLLFLVFVGFVASILIQPVFVYRYMVPALGCLWLVFTILLYDLRKHWWILLLFLFIIGLASKWSIASFQYEEDKKVSEMVRTETALDVIDGEDILLFNFDQLQCVFGYYLNNDSYLWAGTPETLIQEIYREFGSIEEASEIRDLLDTGKTVWYLGSFNARDEIIEIWAEDGILAEEIDSCLLERYWFNLYRLTLVE